MSFVSELRRRNVLRVVFAYLVVGWLLTEVLTTILPELGAPGWAPRMVILIFAFGFPLAIILPWIYELTPDGIKRESDIAEDDQVRGSSKVFDYVALAAVALLVVVVAVLGARTTTDEPGPQQTIASDTSIAVLPFVNLTGDKGNDYLSDGLTETLLHMLTQHRELQVAARTSSFAFKGQSKTILEIAAALNVAHVLEGSVQLANNRIRITAQLIRAADGFHVWSANFDRNFDDIFVIQDEIASEVGRALTVSLLGTGGSQAVAGVGTENPDAYDLYLQALGERATFSYGGLQAAENLLKGALATDPDFHDAKTELAINYLHQAQTGLMDPGDAVANCRALTDQVLDARPTDPVAKAISLFVGATSEDDVADASGFMSAVDALEVLVAQHPSDYEIRSLLARMLELNQQTDRALVVQLEALQQDPFNPRIHFELGSLYLQLKRPVEARAALEKSLEIEPQQPNAYGVLAQVSLQEGDAVDVVRQMLKAFETDPRDHELPGFLAVFLYDLGLIEEGDDFRNLVFALAPTSDIAYQVELRRAINTGDTAASLQSARRAVEENAGARHATFSQGVQYLMTSAAANGDLAEITAYLEQHAPGIFAINAESVPLKYRNAQVAALDAWYLALPRDDLLRRLDDLIHAAELVGIDPLENPRTRLGVQAFRGETEQAIETALAHVFSQSVATDLRWRETFSRAQFADIVADDRIKAALQRWEAEYDTLREQVRAYLADLSSELQARAAMPDRHAPNSRKTALFSGIRSVLCAPRRDHDPAGSKTRPCARSSAG